jgi:hypothetical protein
MKTLNENLNRIVIKDGDLIEFVDFTKNLGIAGFTVCPQFKYGKLVKISIYPGQQENDTYYLELDLKEIKKDYYTIQSYNNLDNPMIWKHFYCKEHKCQSFYMSVPRGSKYLWFEIFSDNISIGFLKSKIK